VGGGFKMHIYLSVKINLYTMEFSKFIFSMDHFRLNQEWSRKNFIEVTVYRRIKSGEGGEKSIKVNHIFTPYHVEFSG
jgi:hypothetical protein